MLVLKKIVDREVQKVGICHTNLDLSSPFEISACKLCPPKNSHCGITCCYHNVQYRNSQLVLNLIISDIFFLPLSSLHCSLAPPAPGLSPDMFLTFYPTNKMTYYCNCVLVSLQKDLGRVLMKRRTCLTFGQQNGNPHLLYFSCRQL